MSARDARTGPARDRATVPGATSGAAPAAGRRRPRRATGGAAARAPPGRRRAGVRPAPGDGLVVGTVPAAARVTGVAAGAGRARRRSRRSSPPTSWSAGRSCRPRPGSAACWPRLLVPVAHLAVGVGAGARRRPEVRARLRRASPGRWPSGQLLIEIYRGSSSTVRPAVEVLAGERVLTSSVEVGPGWVLGVVALGADRPRRRAAPPSRGGARSWTTAGRSTRSARCLAGAAVLLGVATVLCLALPAADVPDQLVTDPATGLRDGGDPGGTAGAAGAARAGAARRAAARRRRGALLGHRAVAAAAPGRGRRPAGDHRHRPGRGADRAARRGVVRRSGVDACPGAGLRA